MANIKITGCLTVDSPPQLHINKLVRNGYIAEGKKLEGMYQARKGDPVLNIVSDLTTKNRFIQIKYNSILDSRQIEYEIKILAVHKKIGNNKGLNYYSLCCVSGKPAKILYYDFWNQMYVHRKAYSKRLYYPIEICSKQERIYERAYIVRQKLLRKLLDFKNYSYRGNMTNIHKRIGMLMKEEKALQLLKDERSDKLFAKFNK